MMNDKMSSNKPAVDTRSAGAAAKSHMKKTRIGVVSIYESMEEDFRKAASSMPCEIVFRRGLPDAAREAVLGLANEDHCEVIVSNLDAVLALRSTVHVPMVFYNFSRYMPYKALIAARDQFGGPLAFVSGREANERIHINLQSVGCVVHTYIIEDKSQADGIVRRIWADGCKAMVTAVYCVAKSAKQSGLPVVKYDFISDREIETVLNEAISTAENLEALERHNGWARTILDAFPFPVLSTNEDYTINYVNDLFLKLLHLKESELLGRSFPELAEQNAIIKKLTQLQGDCEIIKINGDQYLASREIIFSGGKRCIGILYRFQPALDIQNKEILLRRKSMSQGFTAQATFRSILGESPAIKEALLKAQSFANTNYNILLIGESGSGKDIFAQAIHNGSSYRNGPFLAINCAAFPETLLESELFGYEEGTFSGGKRGGKAGLLEMAHRGTLFLDEIGEMPLALQPKLLRVLQERQVRRLGGNRNIHIDVRIISATNRDLRQAIQEKTFREDLYYRLNVLPVTIPALRLRKEDIPILAEYFAHKTLHIPTGTPILTPAGFSLLQAYDWPGNVRELSSLMERLIVLSDGFPIDEELVRHEMAEQMKVEEPETIRQVPLDETEPVLQIHIGTIKEMEAQILRQLYDRTGGDHREIEDITGMSRTTCWRRLKEYQIEN